MIRLVYHKNNVDGGYDDDDHVQFFFAKVYYFNKGIIIKGDSGIFVMCNYLLKIELQGALKLRVDNLDL